MRIHFLAAGAVFASLYGMSMPASADLVAYFGFNGNAQDSSGNGNNASVNGANLTTDRSGNANSAYAFNGSSDYISTSSLPLPSPLNIGSQSWTVSAWVNTTGVSNNIQLILGRYECGWNCAGGGSGQAAIYSLALNGDIPVFSVRSDMEHVYQASASGAVSAGAWHLITGVLDQTVQSLNVYVDGVLAGTQTLLAGETFTDSGSPLEIGRYDQSYFASPAYYFSGAIDEVRVYNTALDLNSIRALADLEALPEPASPALLAASALGLFIFRRRLAKR